MKKNPLQPTLARTPGLQRTAWALLIAAPFLQLLVLWLATGNNPFTSYPVWSDEMDYWRSLFSFQQVGLPKGYNGVGEYIPAVGTLSVHGLTPLLFYGGLVKAFGLTFHSLVLYNAIWVSAASAVFCWLVRPKASISLSIAGMLMIYVPSILYATTSMTEQVNYALLLLYFGFLWRYEKNGSRWARVLCWCTVAFACLYRITYFVLFLPLVWLGGERHFSWRLLAHGFGAFVICILCYLATSLVTAPYPYGFLYNWFLAPDSGTFVQMFLSHAKANLYDYFIRHTDSPMEDALRKLYCTITLLCFLCTFLRFYRDNGHLRLRFSLNRKPLCGFIILATAFSIVVILYETNDWSDFRTLAPILWGVVIGLLLQKSRFIPAVALAGSLWMLATLCTTPPVGAFADETRYAAPVYSQAVQQACEAITYDPEATDPFQNTIRADLSGLQVLAEVDPAMGMLYGWFTSENAGNSRWILTDHLKIVLEGYESVVSEHGAKVFRRIEP